MTELIAATLPSCAEVCVEHVKSSSPAPAESKLKSVKEPKGESSIDASWFRPHTRSITTKLNLEHDIDATSAVVVPVASTKADAPKNLTTNAPLKKEARIAEETSIKQTPTKRGPKVNLWQPGAEPILPKVKHPTMRRSDRRTNESNSPAKLFSKGAATPSSPKLALEELKKRVQISSSNINEPEAATKGIKHKTSVSTTLDRPQEQFQIQATSSFDEDDSLENAAIECSDDSFSDVDMDYELDNQSIESEFESQANHFISRPPSTCTFLSSPNASSGHHKSCVNLSLDMQLYTHRAIQGQSNIPDFSSHTSEFGTMPYSDEPHLAAAAASADIFEDCLPHQDFDVLMGEYYIQQPIEENQREKFEYSFYMPSLAHPLPENGGLLESYAWLVPEEGEIVA
jgi:hypothetical protein